MTKTTDKKSLHDIIEKWTPDMPFAEAKEGFRQLVVDIKAYWHKHKGDKPQGIIMRNLVCCR